MKPVSCRDLFGPLGSSNGGELILESFDEALDNEFVNGVFILANLGGKTVLELAKYLVLTCNEKSVC